MKSTINAPRFVIFTDPMDGTKLLLDIANNVIDSISEHLKKGCEDISNPLHSARRLYISNIRENNFSFFVAETIPQIMEILNQNAMH
jgi:hypothetical protein